jgi:hypothetical protein
MQSNHSIAAINVPVVAPLSHSVLMRIAFVPSMQRSDEKRCPSGHDQFYQPTDGSSVEIDSGVSDTVTVRGVLGWLRRMVDSPRLNGAMYGILVAADIRSVLSYGIVTKFVSCWTSTTVWLSCCDSYLRLVLHPVVCHNNGNPEAHYPSVPPQLLLRGKESHYHCKKYNWKHNVHG